ncbi:MAG: hypothetical protein IJA34_10975 [Lachnospiraceae bacterium]|nr:hypothetical protein [Lachnospiraceae bacterium]
MKQKKVNVFGNSLLNFWKGKRDSKKEKISKQRRNNENIASSPNINAVDDTLQYHLSNLFKEYYLELSSLYQKINITRLKININDKNQQTYKLLFDNQIIEFNKILHSQKQTVEAYTSGYKKALENYINGAASDDPLLKDYYYLQDVENIPSNKIYKEFLEKISIEEEIIGMK